MAEAFCVLCDFEPTASPLWACFPKVSVAEGGQLTELDDRSYSYGMIFLVIHIKSGNNSLPMEGEWNGGHAFT